MMAASLLRASIDGAIVAVLVWIVVAMLPRLAPATRTALWWCVAAKCVLALAWTTPIELRVLPTFDSLAAVTSRVAARVPSRVAARTGLAGRTDAVHKSSDVGPGQQATGDAGVNWPLLLAALWSTGLITVLTIDVRRSRRTRAAIRTSTPATDDTAALASSLAQAMGLRRAPVVRMSAAVATPLVTGILRPQILLPSTGAPLSADEQRMALCHELSHVKRRDLWLGLIPAAAERLFFFHPLVRLAAREYTLCREAACDAAVMDTLATSARDYGRLLLSLGVSRQRAGMAIAGAASSHSMLKRRIAMLRESAPCTGRGRLLSAVAVAVAIAAVVPLRLVVRAQAPSATHDAPKNVSKNASAATVLPQSRFDIHAWVHDVAKKFIGLGPAWLASGEHGPGMRASGNQSGPRDLNYVLFLDEHNTNMSGSTSDIERARKYRRGNERLLWFRQNGSEYVVRDPNVLDQINGIWRPVGEVGEAQGAVGAKQAAIGAKQGHVGARQGVVGEEQGVIGARQADLGARQTILAERDQRVRTDAEREAIRGEVRKLDDESRGLDEEMRKLDVKMRELDEPMRDLDAQMRVLDVEMRALDQKMREASERAQSQMRELVERAIASGAAERVR